MVVNLEGQCNLFRDASAARRPAQVYDCPVINHTAEVRISRAPTSTASRTDSDFWNRPPAVQIPAGEFHRTKMGGMIAESNYVGVDIDFDASGLSD